MAELSSQYGCCETEIRFLLSYANKFCLSCSLPKTRDNAICFLRDIDDSVRFEGEPAVRRLAEHSKETKLDVWKMFRNQLFHFELNFSHDFLRKSPKLFVLITEFGAVNDWTEEEDKQSLLSLISIYLHKYLGEEAEEDDCLYHHLYVQILSNLVLRRIPINTRTFRACQLYYMFLRWYFLDFNVEPDSDLELDDDLMELDTPTSTDYLHALRVLWSSISEPLVSIEEFLIIFIGVHPEDTEVLQFPWIWYCHYVRDIDPNCYNMCPRSLKHLTRCVIRQRLREKCLLPEGIEELGLPGPIKQYLHLRDFRKIN